MGSDGGLEQISCNEALKLWPGVDKFVARRLAKEYLDTHHKPVRAGSDGFEFKCAGAWIEALSTPALWLRGAMDSVEARDQRARAQAETPHAPTEEAKDKVKRVMHHPLFPGGSVANMANGRPMAAVHTMTKMADQKLMTTPLYVVQVLRTPIVTEQPWSTKSAVIGDIISHEQRVDVWPEHQANFSVEWSGGQTGAQRLLSNVYELRMSKRIVGGEAMMAVPTHDARTQPWKSKMTAQFIAMDQEGARKRLGAKRLTAAQLKSVPLRPQPTAAQLASLPNSYDAREVLPGKCDESLHVGNQGDCGACWAFASATVYSARLCHQTSGRTDVLVAPQSYLSCYKETRGGGLYMEGNSFTAADGRKRPKNGCNGGNSIFAWMDQQVAPGYGTRLCNPYRAQAYNQHQCGSYKCSNPAKYRAGDRIYRVLGESAIMNEIHSAGPVVAHIDVTNPFFAYSSGVFRGGGSNAGAHALACIGWGTAGRTKYWLLLNSWGQEWGEKGFGRLLRGRNTLNIERGDGAFAVNTPEQKELPCADAPQCENGGSLDSDCRCQCRERFTGERCEKCAIKCEHFGRANLEKCECECMAGYFGAHCQDYVLGSWKSLGAYPEAEIDFRWKISSSAWHGEAQLARYAAFPPEVRVSGTSEKLKSRSGAVIRKLSLERDVPGYPRHKYYYAVRIYLGKNEFGASKGYTHAEVPVFGYNEEHHCVFGGNPIKTGAAALPDMCGKSDAPPPNPPPPVSSIDPACVDLATNCGGYLAGGYCSGAELTDEIRKKCPRSCGLCPPPNVACVTSDGCELRSICPHKVVTREVQCSGLLGDFARQYPNQQSVTITIEMGGEKPLSLSLNGACTQCQLVGAPPQYRPERSGAPVTVQTWHSLVFCALIGLLGPILECLG
jgi:cathepsin B